MDSTTGAEVIEHVWIPLADGTRLAARIWLPLDAREHPVPAIFEYLPYRLSEGTAVWDHAQMHYFAQNGYAGVRVDIRGSGNSDGRDHGRVLRRRSRPTRSRCCGGSPRSRGATARSA